MQDSDALRGVKCYARVLCVCVYIYVYIRIPGFNFCIFRWIGSDQIRRKLVYGFVTCVSPPVNRYQAISISYISAKIQQSYPTKRPIGLNLRGQEGVMEEGLILSLGVLEHLW
jgi:hypothetical protein